MLNCSYFYPRPPGGGRLCKLILLHYYTRISIHALRVEGDECHVHVERIVLISIHALRVEGDCKLAAFLNKMLEISIHALRVEGDSKNGQNFRLFLRKREKNLPL